jgi:hypothetical protein
MAQCGSCYCNSHVKFRHLFKSSKHTMMQLLLRLPRFANAYKGNVGGYVPPPAHVFRFRLSCLLRPEVRKAADWGQSAVLLYRLRSIVFKSLEFLWAGYRPQMSLVSAALVCVCVCVWLGNRQWVDGSQLNDTFSAARLIDLQPLTSQICGESSYWRGRDLCFIYCLFNDAVSSLGYNIEW